jgi:hypothetical protein
METKGERIQNAKVNPQTKHRLNYDPTRFTHAAWSSKSDLDKNDGAHADVKTNQCRH